MTIGIVGNPGKENLLNSVDILLNKLKDKDLRFLLDKNIFEKAGNKRWQKEIPEDRIIGQEDIFRSADIICAFGGDGTILRVARSVAHKGIPILGVNLGKLGFLAEVSAEELPDCIDEIVADDYIVSRRTMLEAYTGGDEGEPFFALNDFVIDRGGTFRVIDIEIYIDNDFLVTYKGDGVIIGTPTGSSGYSLSCGGPIIPPGTDVFIITPISPHTLNARPVIVSDSKVIKVIVRSQEHDISLTADGQLQQKSSTPFEITFKKSSFTTNLIKRKVRSFYDVLRSKLMWGRDVRIRNDIS